MNTIVRARPASPGRTIAKALSLAICCALLLAQQACSSDEVSLALGGINIAADGLLSYLSANKNLPADQAAQYTALAGQVASAVETASTEFASTDSDLEKTLKAAEVFLGIQFPVSSDPSVTLLVQTLQTSVKTFLQLLPGTTSYLEGASGDAMHLSMVKTFAGDPKKVTKIGKVDKKKLSAIAARARAIKAKAAKALITAPQGLGVPAISDLAR